MISTRRESWIAARPWVVIDPDARPALHELRPPRELELLPARAEPLPARERALSEPGATTAKAHEAWWYLPPGATLLLLLAALVGLLAFAQTESQLVRKGRAQAGAHAAWQARHRRPLPKKTGQQRSPWSTDQR